MSDHLSLVGSVVDGDHPQDESSPLRAELERVREALAGAEDKIRNLEIALESSRRIGAAVGILMAQHRVGLEAAFDLLRQVSQTEHRKLRDIADDVVYTGAVLQNNPVLRSVDAAARATRTPDASACSQAG